MKYVEMIILMFILLQQNKVFLMKWSELSKFVFDVFHSQEKCKNHFVSFCLRNFELRLHVYFNIFHCNKTKILNEIVEIVQKNFLMFSARIKFFFLKSLLFFVLETMKYVEIIIFMFCLLQQNKVF